MTTKVGTSHTSLASAVERIIKGSWPILPELCGAAVSIDRHRFDPAIGSGLSPVARPGWRDDLHVWELSVRCWNAHTRLAQELDHMGRVRNERKIDALGSERREALLALARARSRSLHGILWKRTVMVLFLSNDEEAAALLSSSLSDCDRLLGAENDSNHPNDEPSLVRPFSRVAEITEQMSFEAEHYDDYDAGDRDDERAQLVSRIEVLSAELETAISAVSDSPAMTFVGLRAKLKLYDSFAERGMMAGPLATMRRSMLDDLDRLLRKYVAKQEFFGEEG
jgi:hypothetical protein